MNRLQRFIDTLSVPMLALFTALMLGAPFIPEPHLVEKVRMMIDGTLTQPLDIFDVFWHLAPAVLLGGRLARLQRPGS